MVSGSNTSEAIEQIVGYRRRFMSTLSDAADAISSTSVDQAGEPASEVRLVTMFAAEELAEAAWVGLDLGISPERTACHFVRFISYLRYASGGRVRFWLRVMTSLVHRKPELQFLTDMIKDMKVRVPGASDDAEYKLFADAYMQRKTKVRAAQEPH